MPAKSSSSVVSPFESIAPLRFGLGPSFAFIAISVAPLDAFSLSSVGQVPRRRRRLTGQPSPLSLKTQKRYFGGTPGHSEKDRSCTKGWCEMGRPIYASLTIVMWSVLSAVSYASNITDPGVFSGTPVESWSYYEMTSAGHGQSITYFPTSTSDFASAVFQGYVKYDPLMVPPVGWQGSGAQDSFQIFSTYVLSTITQTIPIQIDGDDGHSLFVNGAFAAGGGFAVIDNYSLSLTANVPVNLILAGYNGPGGWNVGIWQTQPVYQAPFDNSIPGIEINASGVFSTPEPSNVVLLSMGGLTVFSAVFVKRLRRR